MEQKEINKLKKEYIEIVMTIKDLIVRFMHGPLDGKCQYCDVVQTSIFIDVKKLKIRRNEIRKVVF